MEARARVLVLPYTSGGNPYLELLADGLRDSGVDVTLVEGDHRSPLLGPVLQHGRPDVIHLQWHHRYFRGRSLPGAVLRTLHFLIEVLLLRALGVRFVWTVHNVVHHDRRRAGWELRACRVLARLVDAIVVHCPYVMSTVARAYQVGADRFTVVPHGHFATRTLVDRDEAREALALPPRGRVLLYFGWVRHYKGLDTLLETFAKIEDPDARLVLIGQPVPASLGEDLTVLAAADRRVRTHFEFASDTELDAYLGASDLVVLPYRDTLTSGAVVLAASCGRPVLAPRTGCLNDFPGDAAILYDPKQSDGLRRALEQALRSPLEGMGLAAKRHVDQFPWTLVGAKTAAVYDHVLDRASRAVGSEPADAF